MAVNEIVGISGERFIFVQESLKNHNYLTLIIQVRFVEPVKYLLCASYVEMMEKHHQGRTTAKAQRAEQSPTKSSAGRTIAKAINDASNSAMNFSP
jgi:hypothetical protein